MPIPGNGMRENWFMGPRAIVVDTLGDFDERVCVNLGPAFKLRSADGRAITVRMGSEAGVLVIEPASDEEA